MAINKKGARRIVVDGRRYLWKVRRKPTYEQWCWPETVTTNFVVSDPEWQGAMLQVWCNFPRPETMPGWDDEKRPRSITPGLVAVAIRAGLQAGWEPARPGGMFHLDQRQDGEFETATESR